MTGFRTLLFVLLTCAFGIHQIACATTVFDLVNDWSDSSNPNGRWTYREGLNALPHFSAWQGLDGDFGAAQPAWARAAVGNTFLPSWMKLVAPATIAHDWQLGDVIVHTTDSSQGVGAGNANVIWTSPLAGLIDISGGVWMGRDIGRSNFWKLSLNGNTLREGNIFSGDLFDRSNPDTFNTTVSVVAGDVVGLEFINTSLDEYGDYVGVNLTIDDLSGVVEIININGNYTQTASGLLEIEVGGLTPGTEHDQLQVSGTATLAGVLEVPIVNGFVPAAGNEITFLTASGVVNKFTGLVSPNLATVNPNLALRVVYNSTDVRLQFAAPATDNQFDTQAAAANWSDTGTWSAGTVPGSTNILNVQNLSGAPQQVNVAVENAFVHQLAVTGDTAPITVSVQNGSTLSATTAVTVGNNATIALDTGRLVSSAVGVESGGRLSGNGTVVGDLVVGNTSGPQPATLSPGFSVGHLDVEGDYQQGTNGTMVIELEGTNPGQGDTVDVSGSAELGGTLTVDVSQLGAATAGSTVEILTAGSLSGTFGRVETIGSDEIFIRPIYDYDSGGGGGSVSGGVCDLGDMNCDGQMNGDDTHAFAVALRDLDAYYDGFRTFTTAGGDLDGWAEGEFHPNGRIDFDDIDDFVSLASGAGSGITLESVLDAIHDQANVPEPATGILLLMGTGVFLAFRCPSRTNALYSRECSTAMPFYQRLTP